MPFADDLQVFPEKFFSFECSKDKLHKISEKIQAK